ncbi:hypothetical protein N9A28_07370 [Sulfurimonas sp.]|nr:hypothetical protein [Sulfurimonas sp.]
MKKFLHVSFIIAVLLTIVGCGGGAPKVSQQQAQIKKPANYEKVQAAFKDSLNVYNSHSRWYQDKEQLELTIVGPVYKNPIEKESKAYKKLATLLKKIAKDKTILDKLSNSDISKRYSKVNYVPYKLGSQEDATFSAVYEQRLDSKDKLTQTLQQLGGNGVDRVGQTLAIWINSDDLKNNMYTLEGYKTVKNSTKNRNSAYYHLSKAKSNGTNNQEIINAVLATLQLSIPEYVAIDRKDMLKQGETFRIITDNPDGTATGKVYKFDIESEVDNLNEEKAKTTDLNKLKELDRQIVAVKASKAWREYETKQLLYTTPVNQEDINVLNKYKYTNTTKTFNQLTTTDANEISKALHYALPDPFLMVTFEQYRMLLNQLEMNIGGIDNVLKAHYIRGINAKESKEKLSNNVSDALYDFSLNIPIIQYVTIGHMAYDALDDAEAVNRIVEDKQYSYFFGCSKHNVKNEGLQLINKVNLANIDFGLVLRENNNDEFIYTAINKDETLIFTVNKKKNGQQIGYLKDVLTMRTLQEFHNLPKINRVFEFKTFSRKMYQKIQFGANNHTVLLFTGRNIELYDLKQNKVVRTFSNGGEDVKFMKVSPNGKYLLAGLSGKIRLWNYKTAQLLKEFSKDTDIAGLFKKTLIPSGYFFTYGLLEDDPQDYLKANFTKDNEILFFGNKISLIDPETLRRSVLVETDSMWQDGYITDENILKAQKINTTMTTKKQSKGASQTISFDMKTKKTIKSMDLPGITVYDFFLDSRNERALTMDEGTMVGNGENLNIIDIKTGEIIYNILLTGYPNMVIPSSKGRFLTVYTDESTSFFDLSFLDIASKEY